MSSARIRILHVEDVPADAELAERELRRAGFEFDIRRVQTREAFLSALQDFAPDLILSDYRLPEFDGMQALRLVKEHSAETPVIITTGSVNEETAVECMKAGAVDYVLKEQLGRLGTAVRSALEAQRLRVERRRAEKDIARLNVELEEALAWQRHIFEGSRDAVFVSDEQARFVAVNGAATELTGYSREDLLGMGIPDLHEEPDLAAYRTFHQRILEGEQILSEAPIRKKDGSKVAVEFNNRLVTIGGRRFMHTAGRDVTKRKQLEAQLVQAQKMEAVGRLAGGVAHDFNNLLTVIQGYAELLHTSLANDPERRESVFEIVRAAERAAALTRQLLAFSRRQVLEMRVLDLGTVVADTEKMLRRLIGEDVEVVVVKPATLGRVKADPGQIEQVLVNLAVNSRDAMPGGGRLTLELADATLDAAFATSHDSIPPGRYVVVSVRDTGGGMDAETLGHIFEPFFTTKEKGKGTGLGLAMVYGIVRQSGGYVDVASAPGAGTTFRIYLPRSDARTSSGVRPRVQSRSGSETVLLVEDEAAVRNLARTVLERRGYAVLAAEDGAGALELVDKHPGVIHVLLTDLVMPGMNGRDLAARVRARRPAIKVVFMSGYTADVPTELGTEGGPAFLPKPFSERALTVKLREILDRPRA